MVFTIDLSVYVMECTNMDEKINVSWYLPFFIFYSSLEILFLLCRGIILKNIGNLEYMLRNYWYHKDIIFFSLLNIIYRNIIEINYNDEIISFVPFGDDRQYKR